MGKGRLESFSDGVLAVAITLLAFNLHAGVRSKVPLATQILQQWLVYTFIMEGMAISRFLICYHIFSAGLNRSPVPEQEVRRLYRRYGLATVVFPVIAIVAIAIDVRLVLVLNALLLMYYLGPGLRPIKTADETGQL